MASFIRSHFVQHIHITPKVFYKGFNLMNFLYLKTLVPKPDHPVAFFLSFFIITEVTNKPLHMAIAFKGQNVVQIRSKTIDRD